MVRWNGLIGRLSPASPQCARASNRLGSVFQPISYANHAQVHRLMVTTLFSPLLFRHPTGPAVSHPPSPIPTDISTWLEPHSLCEGSLRDFASHRKLTDRTLEYGQAHDKRYWTSWLESPQRSYPINTYLSIAHPNSSRLPFTCSRAALKATIKYHRPVPDNIDHNTFSIDENGVYNEVLNDCVIEAPDGTNATNRSNKTHIPKKFLKLPY